MGKMNELFLSQLKEFLTENGNCSSDDMELLLETAAKAYEEKIKLITLKIVTQRNDAEESLRVAIAQAGFDLSEYIEEVEE